MPKNITITLDDEKEKEVKSEPKKPVWMDKIDFEKTKPNYMNNLMQKVSQDADESDIKKLPEWFVVFLRNRMYYEAILEFQNLGEFPKWVNNDKLNHLALTRQKYQDNKTEENHELFIKESLKAAEDYPNIQSTFNEFMKAIKSYNLFYDAAKKYAKFWGLKKEYKTSFPETFIGKIVANKIFEFDPNISINY